MLTPNGKNQLEISHGNCYGGTGSASLTVTKAVLNGDGQTEFTFTGSSGLTISPLTRGARNTSMSTNPIALQPGTQYTISEDTPLETGWESQGVSCTILNGREQEIISSETTSITFAPEAGNEITCTFTNAFELDKNGFIKIVKELDPESEGAPANAEFDFTVKDDQNQEVANATLQVGNETTIAIDPGTYTVEEFDIPENWTLEDISCNGETLSNPASVEVQTEETVTCTFTNKLEEPDEGGEIRIEKRTDSENPPSGSEFSFTVDGEPAGTLLIDQGITIPVEAGERTVLELTPPDGWTLEDVDCGGGTPVDNGVVVTVVDGETVTCTFTNNFEREGTFIKIIKRLDSGSDDPKNGAQFNYNLDGSPAATLGIGEEILVLVEPGERTVEELTPPAHWELTGINCGNDQNPATVDVPEGQTVTCTFTNRFNQPTGSLKVKKTTVGGDDNFRFSVSGQPSFSLRNGQQKTFNDLPIGQYTVREEGLPKGWTLKNISCNESGNKSGNGIALSVDEGDDIVCTFQNFKEEDEVMRDVTKLFIHRRVDNLLTYGPGRGRILRRLQEQPIVPLKGAPLKYSDDTDAVDSEQPKTPAPYALGYSAAQGPQRLGQSLAQVPQALGHSPLQMPHAQSGSLYNNGGYGNGVYGQANSLMPGSGPDHRNNALGLTGQTQKASGILPSLAAQFVPLAKGGQNSFKFSTSLSEMRSAAEQAEAQSQQRKHNEAGMSFTTNPHLNPVDSSVKCNGLSKSDF